MDDLIGLPRATLLMLDFKEMNQEEKVYDYNSVTLEYQRYLQSLSTDLKRTLAHLYTWHLGDMYGGQMIKKIVPGPHNSLEFDNLQELMFNLRSKLDPSLADEANTAFDWAIKMMRAYDNHLEQNN